MSTIEKLYIQGIRSFGSNAEDAQNITFSSPVTLILGENGCGKTTVIECLKYALTGETPPGSDRGKNFVHDPKIFSLTDTLGQIKLQVRNAHGNSLSVCRSMKISKRRGKFAFETMDSTMNYLNEAEVTARSLDSISKRCVDVDAGMCQFMGVSKAIINNVLFCHQEDSSWPLDEAKKLKEKFDAIFGITEYNKAIEKVIKIRKEEIDGLKLKEVNLRFLAHLKQEMEDKYVIMQKAQEKCESIKTQCSICDTEMKRIDERLLEIRKVENEYGKHQALKVELETKIKFCKDQIASLEKKIKKPFKGSLSELDIELQNFDRKMAEKKTELNIMEEKLSRLKVQEKGIQQMLAELDKRRCICNQQHQKEQELISKRAKKMTFLCNQLNIPLSKDLEQAPEIVPDVLEKIQNAIIVEECQIVEKTSQYESEDQQHQTEIDTMRVDVTKLEEGIISLQKQKKSHEMECQTIKQKIGEIEISSHRLKVVTQDIGSICESYDSFISKFNQDVMRQNITSGKSRVMNLEKQFRKADERLTLLNSLSKMFSEIELKEKQLQKREHEVRRVKSKHSDNFKNIFSKPVDVNFRHALQAAYENLRRKIKEMNEKQSALKFKKQSYEIERKNLKDELTCSEKEFENLKEKIFENCHSVPYDELIIKHKAVVTRYQLELGAQKSAEAMYKKYITKIEDDPCCPLCHKGMSKNEATDLKSELQDEIYQLPESIKQTEKILIDKQTKYEGLLEMKPLIEKFSILEREIPKRKEYLRSIEDKLSQCMTDSESLELLQTEPSLNLDVINSMIGDMSLLDEAIKEVAHLKGDIEKLKGELPQSLESKESIEDLQLEKSTVSAELENERKQVDNLQQDLDKVVETLNKLNDKKNALKDEQIKLQEGLQSVPQLKERQKDLNQFMVAVDAELHNSQTTLKPLKQKLNTAHSEKLRLKEANRTKLLQMQKKFDSHKNLDTDIQRSNNELLEYVKLNLDVKITQLKDSIKEKQELLTNKTKEIVETSADLEAIKTDCINQESIERDLNDNRELKVLQQKQVVLLVQNEQLSKQLVNLDYRQAVCEKNGLIQKRDEATERKGELFGQIGEISHQISKLKSEIDEPKYKDSMQNYRQAIYEVEIGRRVILDLGQYRVALEWSLLQFHAEKMQNINRLIREYWRLIYRGNDIDYIEIQTDEMNTESAADSRRSYNYRVIQSKNNSEIEMRGRCSAGQRVLASLIIRMALAETFSSNCGVLALDEPTTNLDHFNINSLCDALNRIVEERQIQSNFMLIIITHDENFISTLGKINNYHRVFRNDECKSVIRKVKVI